MNAPRSRIGTFRKTRVETSTDYARRYVLKAESALEKPLPRQAEVHHVDGNPSNDENKNLVICQDRAYRGLLHQRTRIVRLGGDPNLDRFCGRCQCVKPKSAFGPSSQYEFQHYCRDSQIAAARDHRRKRRNSNVRAA